MGRCVNTLRQQRVLYPVYRTFVLPHASLR
jgi:hypothetical protein